MKSIVVRELLTRLGFKMDEKGIAKAEKRIQQFKKFAKWAVVGTIAALGGIGLAAVKSAADMEMLTTQFEVMLGSTEKANALMEKLKLFAARTPFQLQDLAQGTQVLLSFGVAEEKVIDTMRMLGDTAGGNREKLNGLILAYGKVQTKGKASMEEINMMAERGLPIITVLQEMLGVTETQFFKMVSAGKIGRDIVTAAFKKMTSEGGMFYKGMEKASATLWGVWSTMKDNFTLLIAEIGTMFLPTIKKVVLKITELAQAIKTWVGANREQLEKGFMKIVKVIKFLVIYWIFMIRILGKVIAFLRYVGEQVRDYFAVVWAYIKDDVYALIESFKELGLTLWDLLKSLWPVLEPLFKMILGLLVLLLKVFPVVIKFLVQIIDFTVQAINWILELIQAPFEALTKYLGGIFDWIEKKLGFIGRWLGKVIGIGDEITTKDTKKTAKATDDLAKQTQRTLNIQKSVEQKQKITNIKQMNQFKFDVAATKDGKDLKKATAKEIAEAARAAFSLELRKIMIATV